MTAYIITPEQHAQLLKALTTRDLRLHEKCEAMLKAMKPVEPVAYGWVGSDGQIRDCISPETHEVIEGSYTLPLYAKEQQ